MSQARFPLEHILAYCIVLFVGGGWDEVTLSDSIFHGIHSQESTARNPQPGIHSKESTSRCPEPRVSSQESLGVHSQES